MKEKQSENWIDNIVNEVEKYYKGREIVIWGAFETAYNISDKLKERYDIDTAFYVDGDAAKIDNDQVFSPNCLYGKSDKYYVVIPLTFYQSVKERISEYGYREDIDYYYFCDCIVRQEPDYYEDAHGNKIIGKYEGLKFGFFGYNSIIEIDNNVLLRDTCIYFFSDGSIRIGNNTKLKENIIHIYDNADMLVGSNSELEKNTIYIKDKSEVLIGSDAKLKDNHINIKKEVKTVFGRRMYLDKVQIVIIDNAILEMKDECVIRDMHISVYEYGEVLLGEKVEVTGDAWEIREKAKLHIGSGGRFLDSVGGKGSFHIAADAMMDIGKNFTILKNYRIVAASGTKVIIGNDCLMSYNITMYSSDMHSIFDVVTGENINSNDEIRKERKIVIGNHVWLGYNVTLLYNTEIGDGSIIGTMSLVKSKIPNNCIAVGTPAKVIRRNIAWSMDEGADNILDCGEEYINYTAEF